MFVKWSKRLALIGLTILGATLAFYQLCPAGIVTVSGKEEGYWKSHSVVLAEVRDITKDGSSGFTMQLDVLATLSGPYDSASRPNAEVTGHAGITQSLLEAPERDTTVLIVLEQFLKTLPGEDIPQLALRIPNTRVAYMPRAMPVIPVVDFNDGRFLQTVEYLRAARE